MCVYLRVWVCAWVDAWAPVCGCARMCMYMCVVIKFENSVQQFPPLDTILSQFYPAPVPEIHFIPIFPSVFLSSEWPFYKWLSCQNSVYICSLLILALYHIYNIILRFVTEVTYINHKLSRSVYIKNTNTCMGCKYIINLNICCEMLLNILPSFTITVQIGETAPIHFNTISHTRQLWNCCDNHCYSRNIIYILRFNCVCTFFEHSSRRNIAGN